MAKLTVKAGSTSRREYVFVLDSASTTGAGKTGIAFNAAGIKAYYVRPGGSATLITLATQTVTGAYSSGGWVEVDATNMPGVYRFDIPDAVFAASAEKAIVMVSGATGMSPIALEYDLVSYDPLDTVRLGLTALPNVASGSAGAIITSGTGTAQLSTTAGNVTVGTNNDKTGYSLSSSQTFNVTGNITGNLSGSVGSVTGSVGSVTGAVGSVTGSVGSVTGDVGGKVLGGGAGTITGDGVRAASVTGNVGGNVVGSVASVTGNVGGNVTGSVGSVVATVSANTTQLAGQTVTAAAGVTFPSSVSSLTATNVWDFNISGYTTAGLAGTYLKGAGAAGDPWTAALPGSYGAGTAGYIVGTNLNATITSRMATFTLPTNFSSLAITVGGAVTAGTVSDKTGYSLSTSQTFNTSGSVGSVTGSVGSVTGSVGSVTGSVGSVTGDVGGKVLGAGASVISGDGVRAASVTGNVGGSVASVTGNVGGNVVGSVASVTNAVTVGTINANAINAAAIATDAITSNGIATSAVAEIQSGLSTLNATQVENAVWDASMASHTGATTYGGRVIRAVNSNVTAQLTGANHIAADIHALQPTVINNTHFAAGAIDSNAFATSAATEIADSILGRNIAGGSDGGRMVKDALRFLRNKFAVVGTTLTVYQEDDTTAAWTSTVTATTGADPITASDPAGP